VTFLLDQNVPSTLVGLLADAHHLAEHVRDMGMRETPDDVVLAGSVPTAY
jgi:predicted nuclease of predicted toxin-antitoxin system